MGLFNFFKKKPSKTTTIADKDVPKQIENSYKKRLKEVNSYTADFKSMLPKDNNGHTLNQIELIFLEEFYNQIKENKIKPYIFIERTSAGELKPQYKGCPIGRVYLRDENKCSIQYYIGMNGKNKVISGTLEDVIVYINKWIRYIINYL